MLPSIFGENLFDDWFGFPAFPEFQNIEKKLYGRRAAREMKTDVREHEDHYELDIDLPGFKKDELTLSLENGYLTVGAAKNFEEKKETNEGKVLRHERYAGAMQRSFYVGESITEEDVAAKFEDGVLNLTIPKKQQPKLPERKTIMIEG
ncbi:MAG: Hsp20/alpha crystallin family protein [Oscillospiraceae bacterium]|nr:Hsp20/alpha crystallin family protein [Oscillospiraceae bacterium]